MSGIPGSGKSTLSKEFEKNGYVVICPDTFRGIISKGIPGREHWTDAMHESDQSVSSEAWKMAHEAAKKAVQEGKSIIFDAMLHTLKARRSLFGVLNKFKVPFYAVYLDVTLETAKERNRKREQDGGRRVPDFVLKNKWRQQSFPTLNEGFKEVHYISNDLEIKPFLSKEERDSLVNAIVNDPRKAIEELKQNGKLKDIFPSLYECWGYAQDNIHHNLPLHEHMITAAELIETKDFEMIITMLLHDIGKRKTKEFFAKVKEDNGVFKSGDKVTLLQRFDLGASFEKIHSNGITTGFLAYDEVEFDVNAHYYDHENVGAIEARRELLSLGFDEEFANKVYTNILFHMDLPYKYQGNNQLKKLIKKVGKEQIKKLILIRKADKLSGSNNDNVLEEINFIEKCIDEIISKEIKQ